MAVDFDNFPTYDPLVKPDGMYMSNIWADFLATFMQTLQGYLSQNGIFVPRLTTAQRDALLSPVEGQMIYLTDATVGPPRTAELQIWLVTAGVGAWVTIV
jgi:hypothetical protein